MIKRMIVMLLSVGVVLGAVYGFQILKSRLIAKALSDYASAPQTVAESACSAQPERTFSRFPARSFRCIMSSMR